MDISGGDIENNIKNIDNDKERFSVSSSNDEDDAFNTDKKSKSPKENDFETEMTNVYNDDNCDCLNYRHCTPMAMMATLMRHKLLHTKSRSCCPSQFILEDP